MYFSLISAVVKRFSEFIASRVRLSHVSESLYASTPVRAFGFVFSRISRVLAGGVCVVSSENAFARQSAPLQYVGQ